MFAILLAFEESKITIFSKYIHSIIIYTQDPSDIHLRPDYAPTGLQQAAVATCMRAVRISCHCVPTARH